MSPKRNYNVSGVLVCNIFNWSQNMKESWSATISKETFFEIILKRSSFQISLENSLYNFIDFGFLGFCNTNDIMIEFTLLSNLSFFWKYNKLRYLKWIVLYFFLNNACNLFINVRHTPITTMEFSKFTLI